VVAALEDLRRRGVEPVLVSGSSREILRPIARRLGVDHVLATRVEVRAGIYTGRILPPQTIGAGKLRAAQAFLERTGANAGRCYAFGDHLSDLPLLEAVGHPRVVAGDPRLERQAHRRGWPVVPTR
ncbi:MAG: HAD-IB family hydrolase, partial [Planctomycetota bacterium]